MKKNLLAVLGSAALAATAVGIGVAHLTRGEQKAVKAAPETYTLVDASINKVAYRDGGLWVRIPDADWLPYGDPAFGVCNQVVKDVGNKTLNTLNSIFLDDVPLSTYCGDAVFNKFTQQFVYFPFNIATPAAEPENIKFSAGTEFPSLAASMQLGLSVAPEVTITPELKAYKLVNELNFRTDTTETGDKGWQSLETNVVTVGWDATNSAVWFKISENDYPTPPTGENANLHTSFVPGEANTLDAILVDGVPLRTYATSESIINRWERPYWAVSLNATGAALNPSEITVLGGTAFPSYVRAKGISAINYSTRKSVTLKPTGVTSAQGRVFAGLTPICVDSVGDANLGEENSFIRFNFSEPIYANEVANQHLWISDPAVTRLLETNLGAGILLDGEPFPFPGGSLTDRAEPLLRMWDNDRTFGMRKAGNAKVSTITIQDGAIFPTSDYIFDRGATLYYQNGNQTFQRVTIGGDDSFFANKNNVDQFVLFQLKFDTVPTTDEGTGKCISEGWYAAAKARFLVLSDADKALFATAEYADAYARLQDWAAANGEVFNGTSFTSASGINGSAFRINETVGAYAYIVPIVCLAAVALVVTFVIKKRKRHN